MRIMSGPWILTSKGGKVLDWNREGSWFKGAKSIELYVVIPGNPVVWCIWEKKKKERKKERKKQKKKRKKLREEKEKKKE